MKLKVGMYVRTKYGIAKIIEFKKNEYYEEYDYFKLDNDIMDEDEPQLWHCLYKEKHYMQQIIKASHNIIDLIEVGDYVNGCLVEKKFPEVEYAEQSIKLKGSTDYFYDIHIKSIVTKEQFESMAYKVEL